MVFNIILPYSYFVFTLYLQGFCNESGHLKLEFGYPRLTRYSITCFITIVFF